MWQRPRTNPKYRVYGMSVSDDFENWSFPIDAMAPDEHDPVGMQVDSLATLASPDIGYIGLAAMSGYKGEGFKVSEKLPQLVYSRDGRDWTRVDRKPYLTVRDKEAWNGGPLITPINPVQVGDEVFIFYYGKNYGNYWGEKTFDGKSIVTSALGLAKLPRDRWVSLAPKETAGEFTTRLVSFANNELHVNVAASGGTLRAELVDFQQRKPVPGYTLADCDPIQVDSLDKTVTWNGQSDLSRLIGTARQQPLVGRAMAVRFHLERAKLFSFYC